MDVTPVSYTHLDVYKRQTGDSVSSENNPETRNNNKKKKKKK